MRLVSVPRRARLPVAALLCAVLPAAAAAQEPGPVSVDSAAAIRAATERPPGDHPFDGWDAVSLPFRAAFLPVRAVSLGIQFALGEAFRPRPPGFLLRALRSARRWGLEYGVAGVGPRSGPGLGVRLERWEPLFVESAMTIRASRLHAVGLVFGDPIASSSDVELGDPLRPDRPRDREDAWGLEVAGSFRRFAEPHFWGVGPASAAADEADYRWDRRGVAAAGSYRGRHLGFRAGVGWEENEVAPGPDDGTPDLDVRFDPASLFGADERTRFLRLELRGLLDLTRWEDLQQRGFRAEAGPTLFRGVGGTDADFVRWDLALSGYLPLNGRQELALHGMGVFHGGEGGRGIPFTHLAALGGSRGLRGFETDRFRDRHMAALMSEWRYEVWREKHGTVRVEGLLFLDAGAVGPEVDRLAEDGLETAWGFGARVLARDDVAVLGYVGLGGDETRVQLETSWAY